MFGAKQSHKPMVNCLVEGLMDLSRVFSFEIFEAKVFFLKFLSVLLSAKWKIIFMNNLIGSFPKHAWNRYHRKLRKIMILDQMISSCCQQQHRFITMTSHKCHGGSNHWQTDYLSKSLFRSTWKNISKLRSAGPLSGESTGDWWIPLSKGQWWRERFQSWLLFFN